MGLQWESDRHLQAQETTTEHSDVCGGSIHLVSDRIHYLIHLQYQLFDKVFFVEETLDSADGVIFT